MSNSEKQPPMEFTKAKLLRGNKRNIFGGKEKLQFVPDEYKVGFRSMKTFVCICFALMAICQALEFLMILHLMRLPR